MNNDLISRSELKKALHNFFDGKVVDEPTYILRDVFCYIDNTPTIAVNCKNCDGYEAGYSAGLKDAERPQGEWKLHGMIYYCSECGHDYEQGGNNFCGNCGAEMKGGAE